MLNNSPTKLIILGLLALALTAVLLSQLWYRQLLPTAIDNAIAKVSTASGITLPVRRNFSLLSVTAVQQIPHPQYQHLSIMRAKIVNRAAIAQPLPQLQLSLTNAVGRLVAQRSLSPQDYLPGQNKPTLIEAKQVKPINIELAAFPAEVYGYELKLLAN